MEFIKSREGFFQNIVNYTVILKCINEKLRGCEDLFYFEHYDKSIDIYCKVKGLESSMLPKLADELNMSLVNGADLFVYNDYFKKIFMDYDYVGLCVDKDRGIFDKLGTIGRAVIKSRHKYVADTWISPERIDADLSGFVSLVSDRYGFIDDDGVDIQSCFTLDYAQGDGFNDSDSLEFMYSIRCLTPEVAEEFAKKWVSTIKEEYRNNHRYGYLIGTMVDPAIMNPEYQGCNRVYGDPSVLIGFVYTDKSMYGGSWVTFDESQLPSKSDWWFQA